MATETRTDTTVHEATASAAREERPEAMMMPATPPVHVPRPAPAPTHGEGVLGSQLTVQQIALIKSTMMRGASDDDVAVFAHVCNKTGLDPFARQIHAVSRRSKIDNEWVDKWVFQVGIDGFRLIAERTGKYLGQTEPEYFDVAGHARTVWLDSKPPIACRIGIKRSGFPAPQYVTVRWDEYVQLTNTGTPTHMWKTKPTVMISKCTEAIGLRKTFPQELSGLYVHEELMHDEETAELEARPVASARATVSMAHAARATEDGDVELLFRPFNGKRVSQLSLAELTLMVSAWSDPSRRATAETRLGAGAVKVIEAAYHAKQQEADAAKQQEAAAVKPATGPTAYITGLLARAVDGQVLNGNDAEELRQWKMDQMDHPEAPKNV